MLLAPDVQEQILFSESVDGLEPMSERAVRAAVRTGSWGSSRCAAPWDPPSGRPVAAGFDDTKTGP